MIAPNRQLSEVGLESSPAPHQTENRFYIDYSYSFVPAVIEHLQGPRAGWLALWTMQNEAGQPLYHLGGLSPAYAPSWVIAQFTDDPWRFLTALSLLTGFFAGLFLILFCNESGLSPLASLVAGISLSSAPLVMSTLPYPMTVAAWCWSAGFLWALTRLAQRQDLLSWSMLAFCAYSMLVTAIPQLVVFNLYILIPYGLYLTVGKGRVGIREAGRFLMLSGSAVFVGALLTLPIYLDVLTIYHESARSSAVEPGFFMRSLPALGGWSDCVHNLVTNVIPEIFLNRHDRQFPFGNIGLRLTPLIVYFAIVCLLMSFKKSWGWWLAIGMFGLVTYVHPLYAFAVDHLAFDLDQNIPLGTMMLPITIVVGYGADALVKRTAQQHLFSAASFSALCILAILIYGVTGFSARLRIDWIFVSLMIILVLLLFAQVRKVRPLSMIGAIVIVLATSTWPLMLRVDAAAIAKTSPLIEMMRSNMPLGSRYAFAAYPSSYVLPPDFNAQLGIPSVHSYDSLSPERYHTLIQALGGKMIMHGRWNWTIDPDYNSTMFWMSDISLMLSPSMLSDKSLMYVGEESDLYLYKVSSHMNDSLQINQADVSMGGDSAQIPDPRVLSVHTPTKLSDEGDQLEYQVTPGAPSVLVLSQKFYPDWKAMTLVQSNWVPAKTVVINDVFQGVLLPQDAQRVKLRYMPYVRFAWVAHVFWLCMLIVVGFQVWRKRRQPVLSKALAA